MPFLLNSLPIREHLLALLPQANAAFTQKLVPGVEAVLGLRVPDMRALAQQIVKSGRWADYLSTAIADAGGEQALMEERMLYGLVLSRLPVVDAEEYLHRVAQFVPWCNAWPITDVFKLSGKATFWQQHRELLWQHLTAYMAHPSAEYTVRFGVVVSMQHFIDEAYILQLLDHYAAITHEGYYVRMAVAWAVAECFIRQPAPTLSLLRSARLPAWTHNKAIQKACESYRVDAETKQLLRTLKRK